MNKNLRFSAIFARRLTSYKEKNFSSLIIRIGIIATALSVAVMIMASCLISGFQNTISEKIFGFWGHIHILHNSLINSYESEPISIKQKFYPSLDNSGPVSYMGPIEFAGIRLSEKQIRKSSYGNIHHIQAYAFKSAIMQAAGELEGIVLKGVDKHFDWVFMQKFILRGRPILMNDSFASRDIIISEQTAARLQIDTGKVLIINIVNNGEQLKRRFHVCGIYRTGLEEYDKKFALTDIRVIQDILGWTPEQVSGFEVFLDDVRDVDVYTSYIYENVISDTLYTESIRQKLPNIFEWLELQSTNETLIFSLMILVAIINLSTALLILIVERTNMIGILKSLGANNWSIQLIFLRFSANILLKGLFWGNVIGIGLALLQRQFKLIKLSEKDYYLSYAPIHFDLFKLAMINGVTLLIVVMLLIVPSFLVKTITPVKAVGFK